MIIKGTSRGNPKQLAAHLLRADTNERVEILELNSPVDDLGATFRSWQALTAATDGTKGLYHANISPDAGYAMTPEQWERAADLLAEKLGLEHQPRTIILHEKEGREHIHVVWQRTDTDTMTLVSDSWNYLHHEEASLAMELEFGHEHVPGKHAKRDRDLQPEFPRAEATHAEWQQAERTGLDPAERKEQITALFQQSDSAAAFQAALEEAGYILAQGDRRDYVIVDGEGEVHSLARQIDGIKTKELRAFMAEIDRDALPTASQAREHVTLQQQQPQPETPQPENPQPSQPAEQQAPAAPPEPVPPPEAILTQQEIDKLEQAVMARHAKDAQKLKNLQAAEMNQTRFVLDQEISEKMHDFDAVQDAAWKRKERQLYPDRDRVERALDAARNLIFHESVSEERRQRDRQWQAFLEAQEEARTQKLSALTQAKQTDLNDLSERHDQKQRELKLRAEEDLARLIREEEEAKRILAEQQERQRRLEEEQTYGTDGPDPPKLTQ